MHLNPYAKASLLWLAAGPEEQYDLFFDIGHQEAFAQMAIECFGSLSEGLGSEAETVCQGLLAETFEFREDAYSGEQACAIREMAREALRDGDVDIVPAAPWIPLCLRAFESEIEIGQWLDWWDGRPVEFMATFAGNQEVHCRFLGFRRLFASIARCFTCTLGRDALPVTLALSDYDKVLPYCLVLPVRAEDMAPPSYGSLRGWVLLKDGY